jgi:hypothetical protein
LWTVVPVGDVCIDFWITVPAVYMSAGCLVFWLSRGCCIDDLVMDIIVELGS